jgi:hypothetical protein
MATMTKTATMTWPSLDDQLLPAIVAARDSFIETQVGLDKTDGEYEVVSLTVTKRSWSDQSAADEWATFITQTATDAGTTVSVVITDKV